MREYYHPVSPGADFPVPEVIDPTLGDSFSVNVVREFMVPYEGKTLLVEQRRSGNEKTSALFVIVQGAVYRYRETRDGREVSIVDPITSSEDKAAIESILKSMAFEGSINFS